MTLLLMERLFMLQNKYANSWITRAAEDIKVIEKLIVDPHFAHSVCFHAQQAGEKYLKGFLAYHGKNVRKVHDLTILIKDCAAIDPNFNELQEAADHLTQFYTEARYPGDIEEFTSTDAQQAAIMVQQIQKFVQQRLSIHS